MDNHVIKDLVTDKAVDCFASCKDTLGCVSFNLCTDAVTKHNICELNNATQNDIIADKNCVYYTLNIGRCQTLIAAPVFVMVLNFGMLQLLVPCCTFEHTQLTCNCELIKKVFQLLNGTLTR